MDVATIWGLVLTIIGTIASIGGAVISLKQAKEARSAASEAVRMRGQLVNQRRTSDLAGLKVHCERAIKTMEKYGPGASASSLKGVNPASDAAEVQTLILEASQLRDAFGKGEVDVFVSKVSPLLELLVDSGRSRDVKNNGKAILMEALSFLAVVKSSLDARRESAEAEA